MNSEKTFCWGVNAEDAVWNSLQSSGPDPDPDPLPIALRQLFVFSLMESSVNSIF